MTLLPGNYSTLIDNHISESENSGVGWLSALADKQLCSAINAMHRDPAHRWTLQELAKCTGMSRSVFALRFKETVGTTAMNYLSRWRMLKAADILSSSNTSIAVISNSSGYESESAFSTAFKKQMGLSPRHYGRAKNQPQSQDASLSNYLE